MAEINIGTKILSNTNILSIVERLNIKSLRRPAKKNVLWAYTDGSMSGNELAYASSAMLISQTGLPKLIVETKPAGEKTTSNTAEINAVSLAINEAFAQGFDQLIIFHDADILDPTYATKKMLENPEHPAYLYFQQLKSLANSMNVTFAKIKGHENPSNKIVDLVARENSNLLAKQLDTFGLVSANKASSSEEKVSRKPTKGICAPKTVFFTKNKLQASLVVYNNLGAFFNEIRIPKTSNIPNEYATNSLREYMRLFGIDPSKVKLKYNTSVPYVKREDAKRVLKKIYNLTTQQGAK